LLNQDQHSNSPPASGPAAIVVTIEKASAAERVELFGRAFGLSTREYELLGLIATGSDTRSMAREMPVSEHTVAITSSQFSPRLEPTTASPFYRAPGNQARGSQMSPLP
jgi:FixJ family two-component response regulator